MVWSRLLYWLVDTCLTLLVSAPTSFQVRFQRLPNNPNRTNTMKIDPLGLVTEYILIEKLERRASENKVDRFVEARSDRPQ